MLQIIAIIILLICTTQLAGEQGVLHFDYLTYFHMQVQKADK